MWPFLARVNAWVHLELVVNSLRTHSEPIHNSCNNHSELIQHTLTIHLEHASESVQNSFRIQPEFIQSSFGSIQNSLEFMRWDLAGRIHQLRSRKTNSSSEVSQDQFISWGLAGWIRHGRMLPKRIQHHLRYTPGLQSSACRWIPFKPH